MDFAIDFYNQLFLMTIEIRDEKPTLPVQLKTNRMLPEKFLVHQFPTTKHLPKYGLALGLIFSQSPCDFCNPIRQAELHPNIADTVAKVPFSS